MMQPRWFLNEIAPKKVVYRIKHPDEIEYKRFGKYVIKCINKENIPYTWNYSVYYECEGGALRHLKDYVALSSAIVHAEGMNRSHPTVKSWE